MTASNIHAFNVTTSDGTEYTVLGENMSQALDQACYLMGYVDYADYVQETGDDLEIEAAK